MGFIFATLREAIVRGRFAKQIEGGVQQVSDLNDKLNTSNKELEHLQSTKNEQESQLKNKLIEKKNLDT